MNGAITWLVAASLLACTPRRDGPASDAVVSPTDVPVTGADSPMPTAPSKPASTHLVALRESVRLRSDTTLCVEDVVVEEIAPSPDEARSHPAGSGVVVTLSLKRDWQERRATLSALSRGYDSHDVAWLDEHRITLVEVVDPHRNPRVALRIERATDERTGAPAQLVRASREQDVALDEHTRLRFLYHGHKIVSSEGEISPLLAAVELLPVGGEPEQQHLTLGPEADRMVWTWRDYRFTVRDVLYGEWMDLAVERLKLELVEPDEA